MNKRTYLIFYIIIVLLCAAVVFLSYINDVNAIPYVLAVGLPTILVAVLTKTSYAARINLFLGELTNKKGKYNEESIKKFCTNSFIKSEDFKKLGEYKQTVISKQKVSSKEKTKIDLLITTKDWCTYQVKLIKENGSWKIDEFVQKSKPKTSTAFEGLKK